MKRYLLYLIVALGCASAPVQPAKPKIIPHSTIYINNYRPEMVSLWVFQNDRMRILGTLEPESRASFTLSKQDIADIVTEKTERVNKFLTTEVVDSTKFLVFGVHTLKTDHYYLFEPIKVPYDSFILVRVNRNIGASTVKVFR